jgi:hypothetical protein
VKEDGKGAGKIAIAACAKLSYNPYTVCCRVKAVKMLGHLVFGLYASGSAEELRVVAAPVIPAWMRRVLGAMFRRR